MSDEGSGAAGSPSREQVMRELIALEKRCAELRANLGLEYRVFPAPISESAEQAVQALVGALAHDFLSVHAADGTYLWASPSCARLFGWEPEALVGRSAYDLFHPDDLARLAANHEQHVDGMGAEAVEYRLRTADGSFRWVETHSANCKDPSGLPQIVCFTHDITARHDRDEEVRSLLQHYEREHKRPNDDDEFLRVCAWCKAIGDDADGWRPLEVYLASVTERSITHGICEGCVSRLKPR
jgi:PAS domain S-box-containing protein